jgi:hypothetical protein
MCDCISVIPYFMYVFVVSFLNDRLSWPMYFCTQIVLTETRMFEISVNFRSQTFSPSNTYLV